MMTRLVTVFGATGAQGGSVVDTLLKDKQWKIRAITRNASSDRARDMQSRGVEIMEGDMNDKTLDRFFHGAYACFIVTNYWDKSNAGKEKDQGKRLVDAARKAGVQHLIYSALPNVHRISQGKIQLSVFSDKGVVEEYIRELQDSSSPPFKYASYFVPSFYYQNFQTWFLPKKEGDKYVMTLPQSSNITMFDVNDTGATVAAILREPEKTNGKSIGTSAFHGSLQDMFEILKTESGYGDKMKLKLVPVEEYAKTGKEVSEMFDWFDKYTNLGPEVDRDFARKQLGVPLTTFEDWAATAFKLEPRVE